MVRRGSAVRVRYSASHWAYGFGFSTKPPRGSKRQSGPAEVIERRGVIQLSPRSAAMSVVGLRHPDAPQCRAVQAPFAPSESVPQRLWNSPAVCLQGVVPLAGNPSPRSVSETSRFPRLARIAAALVASGVCASIACAANQKAQRLKAWTRTSPRST